MPGYELRIDQAAVTALLTGVDGPVFADLTRRAERVQAAARVQARRGPYASGKLSSRIVKRPKLDTGYVGVGVSVGVWDLDYALYLHEGTRPHVIPGNPLLSFFWRKIGAQAIFRSVHHPGTKPNRYLTDNLPLAGLD